MRQAQTLLHLGRNKEAHLIYNHLKTINPDDSRVQTLAGTLAKTYLPSVPDSQPPIEKTVPHKTSSIIKANNRSTSTVYRLIAADKTDVGKQRDQNEDCAYKRVELSEDGNRGLFIVADGEKPYGEVASRLAVETISKALDSFFKPLLDQPTIKLSPASEDLSAIQEEQPVIQKTRKISETSIVMAIEEQLKVAIQQANKAILRYGEQQSAARGLGSTVTIALIQNDQAYIANVGNSRTYLLRNQQLTPITRDHSLVARLVESKQIEPEDVYTHPQHNLIYRSLGAGHKSIDIDIFHEVLQPGDRLLLCSDGLWEMVMQQELLKALNEQSSPQKICDTLIDMANANGGEDNITALVVSVIRR